MIYMYIRNILDNIYIPRSIPGHVISDHQGLRPATEPNSKFHRAMGSPTNQSLHSRCPQPPSDHWSMFLS